MEEDRREIHVFMDNPLDLVPSKVARLYLFPAEEGAEIPPNGRYARVSSYIIPRESIGEFSGFVQGLRVRTKSEATRTLRKYTAKYLVHIPY